MPVSAKKLKTKQEKREELARKKKIKQKKGGTLSAQVLRTRVANRYLGNPKKSRK